MFVRNQLQSQEETLKDQRMALYLVSRTDYAHVGTEVTKTHTKYNISRKLQVSLWVGIFVAAEIVG